MQRCTIRSRHTLLAHNTSPIELSLVTRGLVPVSCQLVLSVRFKPHVKCAVKHAVQLNALPPDSSTRSFVTVVTAPTPPATTYDYVAGCAHLLRNPPVNCAAAHFLVDFVHFATQIRQELAAAYLGTKRNDSLVLRSCVKRSRLQKDCAATISQQVLSNSINYIYYGVLISIN